MCFRVLHLLLKILKKSVKAQKIALKTLGKNKLMQNLLSNYAKPDDKLHLETSKWFKKTRETRVIANAYTTIFQIKAI